MPKTGLNYTSNTAAAKFNEQLVIRTAYEIQERINKLAYGLVDPKNEEKLVGNPRSDINLIEDGAVIYRLTDTDGESFEISVAIDASGIHFDTSMLINIKAQTTIRIIFLLCGPIECIKSAFNIYLTQPKGFFKAKPISDVRIHYGDEVKINPAGLYDFTETEISDQADSEAGGSAEKEKEEEKKGKGKNKEEEKEDL
ncbi:hypothetical protein GAMM_200018 [Gammaproteobacteria bacterium]